MKTVAFHLKGRTPLLMHNERLANPFDPFAKQLKAITDKRKKTDDDFFELMRLQWFGGLYHDEDSGIHIPGWNALSCFVGGGKLHKLGSAIKRGAVVLEDKTPVIYKGPAELEKLFEDKHFVDVRGATVGTKKIMRCRPKFNQWAVKLNVAYDEGAINEEEIRRCVATAGALVGLGDFRPRYGRFEIV